MVKKIEQRAASLEKLRKAALSLFVSQGYHATTLEDIAAAAGLTKGAVYFYFGSKSAVLVDLLGRVQRIVVERMMEAVERAGPSPTEKLVAFLHNQAMLGVTHRDEVLLLILMSLELGGRDADVSERISDIYRRLNQFIAALIRRGQKAGEFRDDVPVKELSAVLMANHDGTFLEWHRRSSELNGRNLVRALRSLVLQGVLRRAAPAQPRPRRTARAAGARPPARVSAARDC
ncbi:MAG: TetR/AcrR family transcriptional regulator [Alphaproteobacteria bacterium]